MDDELLALPGRLAAVRTRIAGAAARAGRQASSVTLLAVSKTKPSSAIRAALGAGQIDFGENYAQELEQKARELADARPAPRLHFIGGLQRNKVAKVVPIAYAIHTVDRIELAREIEKRAAAASVRVRVLVEVNVGGEASKSGCAPADLGALLETIRAMPSLDLRGLMTIPPEVDSPEEARRFFAALRDLRDRNGAADLPELSMGMSHDFEVAIEEGATIVRVGTAIFGSRSAP